MNRISSLNINPVSREQTRQELYGRIKQKRINRGQIKQTLEGYLSYKQYKWEHKTFKTPFHCDPIYKTRQLLHCLVGNMRSEINKTENEMEFHKNMLETHKMAPDVPFTHRQLDRDTKNIKNHRDTLEHHKGVLAYLQNLEIKNGEVNIVHEKT